MSKITENRLVWLGKVNVSRDWQRKDGATRNTRTGRKMPEPVYWWLIENKLIDTDLDTVVVTESGKQILKR